MFPRYSPAEWNNYFPYFVMGFPLNATNYPLLGIDSLLPLSDQVVLPSFEWNYGKRGSTHWFIFHHSLPTTNLQKKTHPKLDAGLRYEPSLLLTDGSKFNQFCYTHSVFQSLFMWFQFHVSVVDSSTPSQNHFHCGQILCATSINDGHIRRILDLHFCLEDILPLHWFLLLLSSRLQQLS